MAVYAGDNAIWITEAINSIIGQTYRQFLFVIVIDGDVSAPTFSDPLADWFTIDTDSRTFVKATNRFGDGGYRRQTGGDTTENKVVNLNWQQDATIQAGKGITKPNAKENLTFKSSKR